LKSLELDFPCQSRSKMPCEGLLSICLFYELVVRNMRRGSFFMGVQLGGIENLLSKGNRFMWSGPLQFL
jgi:hypothetical protein